MAFDAGLDQAPKSPEVEPTKAPPGEDVTARLLAQVESDRYLRLDRLAQYFAAQQHENKRYDWDGCLAPRGPTRGRLPADQIEVPGYYAPLKQRRPCSPYNLARVIVTRFTALLFGAGKFPQLKVESDPDADDFARAVSQAAKLPLRMRRARNVGGACGSVGLSYRWVDGRPRVQVHEPKHVEVLEWEDREELVPRLVVKGTRFLKEEWDPKLKKMVEVEWLARHDWSPRDEVDYEPVRVADLRDGAAEWRVREAFPHALGWCPFVWVQNQPSDDVDGESDYAPLTDADGTVSFFDSIDTLFSSTVKGCTSNVDPTLKLNIPRSQVRDSVVKGSQHALVLGKDGDADYLELSGSSITVGLATVDRAVRCALEVCSCVLVDPEKISGAAQSAKAIEYIYQPMTAEAWVLRGQYEGGIVRVVDGLRRSASSGRGRLRLPPRKVVEKDEATQEERTRWEPRRPGGPDAEVEADWPPFFDPTPSDIQAELSGTQAAVGGKQVLSQETAVRRLAPRFGVDDPEMEMDRIRSDEEWEREGREGLFGGGAGDETPVPDGGEDAEHAGETEERAAHEAGETPEEERAEHGEGGETKGPLLTGAQPDVVIEAGAAAGAGGAKAQDTSLNGAQVSALLEIVKAVVAKEISRESAVAIISASFPLTKEQAEAIVGPEKFEAPEPPAPVIVQGGGPPRPPFPPKPKEDGGEFGEEKTEPGKKKPPLPPKKGGPGAEG